MNATEKNPTFSIETLGCKVNQVDSEKIADDLFQRGFLHGPHSDRKVDVAIINTCTVTSKADSKSLQVIKKATREARQVYVTGCYSELEKDLLNKVSGVTGVISHNEKKNAADIIARKINEPSPEIHWEQTPGQSGKMHKVTSQDLNSQQTQFLFHTRAFVKISDGCNSFCSFCRIPFARGVPVARDAKDILKQVRGLCEQGSPEIVLTGVNIGEYKEGVLNFSQLFAKILAIVEGYETLVRISTIEPHSVSMELVEMLTHKNVAPHLHLALQGGTDPLLKAMNRRYTTEQYRHILRTLRMHDPHFAFSSDIITGFPGESEKDFQDGRDFIEECAFMKLHVFPYSPRPLTKAAQFMDQVSDEEKKRRVHSLLSLSKEMEHKYKAKLLDQKQRFVLEKELTGAALRNTRWHAAGMVRSGYRYFTGTSEYYLKGLVEVSGKKERGGVIFTRLSRENDFYRSEDVIATI